MRHILNRKHKVEINHPIDFLALWVGVLQPLTTIPQIWLVFSKGDASEVSFFMWFCYNVASIIVLIYGIKHKLAPIWFPQILWLIVQTPMMLSPLLLQS